MKSGEEEQKMMTSMTKGRIHYFLGRIEDIESSLKKYEKVSLIYKPIVAWISSFGTLVTYFS